MRLLLKNKTLLLVGGYPGTGKTVISHKILERYIFTYIDKDVIDDVFSNSRIDEKYLKHKEYVWPIIYNAILIPNISLGNSVLIDAPFSSKYLGNPDWIKFMNDLSTKYIFKIKMIWCTASLQTREDRLRQRNHLRDQERFDVLKEFVALEKTFDISFDHINFDTENDGFEKILDFLKEN